MKSLIMISVLLTSGAFAQANTTVYAPNFTCAALQQYVAANSPVGIQMKLGYGLYVAQESQCTALGLGTPGAGVVFGTQDQNFCNVGYVCTEAVPSGN